MNQDNEISLTWRLNNEIKEPEEWLTVDECAKRAEIQPIRLYKARHNPVIKCKSDEGGGILIEFNSLLYYLSDTPWLDTDSGEYWRIADLAMMFDTTEKTIKRLQQDGAVRFIKFKGYLYYNLGDVHDWFERRQFKGDANYPYGDITATMGETWQFITARNSYDTVNVAKMAITGQYAISNLGNVANVRTGLYLEPTFITERHQKFGSKKYKRVNLPIGQGKNKYYLVHRLVAMYFKPNKQHKPIVHHIDNSGGNNEANNLLWVTDEQHGELHRLINAEKWAEYYARVRQIERENEL